MTDVSADMERFAELGVLGRLLKDRSTGRNIIWASNVFVDKGDSYAPSDEILAKDVLGANAGLIRTRASKAREAQAALTKAHAEVFTPGWVVRRMIDEADAAWAESHPGATWQDYVASPRLEITCGEAPYLANRYDAADGTPIPVEERCGILDRKLRLVGLNTASRRSWARWALVALRSTYGYEYQGDNLLIARINVLATMEDFAEREGYALTPWSYRQFVHAISYNLWQMDGLTDMVPEREMTSPSPDLGMDVIPGLEELMASTDDKGRVQGEGPEAVRARIHDWERNANMEFGALKRGDAPMRFDYVIGNPPYQDDKDDNGRKPPLYHLFMDASYGVSDVVELITPARFLFNAGQTPKAWNRKMLADKHLRVLYYNGHGEEVFPNTEIKGGIAITYRDAASDYGAIGFFAATAEMNPIIHKVDLIEGDSNRLDSIVSSQGLYKFTDKFFIDNSSALALRGSGTGNKIVSKFVERFPEGFIEEPFVDNALEYVGLLCRFSSGRTYKYLKREYVQDNPYLDKYCVLVPKANGSGKFGEKLSGPEVSPPGNGSADTFISIGLFESEGQANALVTYLKTKFLRAMLDAKKVTQDNPKAVWSLVPLQDFTDASDIDWSQSVADIDRQLYAKYGLSQDEVDFIETHVKEMS